MCRIIKLTSPRLNFLMMFGALLIVFSAVPVPRNNYIAGIIECYVCKTNHYGHDNYCSHALHIIMDDNCYFDPFVPVAGD